MFNLPSGKARSNARKIKYGLNSRNKKAKATSNVFGGGDSSSDDDDGDELSGRDQTNRQIAAEQAAMRRRAEAAIAEAKNDSIYDYDGAYESFKPSQDKEGAEKDEKKSRYIGDLLKTAKDRERERDIVYERKMAKDQKVEEEELGLQGKEKFVTKAYKRKLAERQRWEASQEIRRKEEEDNDVTKKSAGEAFTSFYGNLSSSTALGGDGAQKKARGESPERESEPKSFTDGFDKPENDSAEVNGGRETNKSSLSFANEGNEAAPKDGDQAAEENTLPIREIREKKVAEARIRYLQRKAALSTIDEQ